MIALELEVSSPSCELAVTMDTAVDLGISTAIEVLASPVPVWDGSTEFIASDTAQVIHTNGYRFIEDIVIDPIPHNYGKITWNGSVITVS